MLDIREKYKISIHANTGAYAFASGQLLRKYCTEVLDAAVGAAGEFYLSSVIKRMITDGQAFKGILVDSFVCVGTPAQLTAFLEQIACGTVPCRKIHAVFDLDNTLVTHPRVKGDYSTCRPKERNIRLLCDLHRAGHYIIIWTARRMRTHAANVGAVIKDVGLVTMKTLQEFHIPYDELHFGKPYADLYIDDLAVNALVDTEKEIGWVSQKSSSSTLLQSRPHNRVVEIDDTIVKSSTPDSIRGEAAYYNKVPESLQRFFPRIISFEENVSTNLSSIVMERVRGVSLTHLLISRALTPGRLLRMLSALETVHSFRTNDSLPGLSAVSKLMYARSVHVAVCSI